MDVQKAELAKPEYEAGSVVFGRETMKARAIIGGEENEIYVDGACLEDIAGWFDQSAEAIRKRAREMEKEAGE